MAVNKVQRADGTVEIDITDTTVTPADVSEGEVFYDRAGNRQEGTGRWMEPVSDPTADEVLITDANGQAIGSGVLIGSVVQITDIATESAYGLVKTNPSQSIALNSNGQLVIGGRMGQFPDTTGLFAPNDREPRYVNNYALLMTDAKGMNMEANRALAIVSGLGTNCQSAPAGTTEYKLNNTYVNRIIAKCCENGYIAKDEATSTQQLIEPVLSVTIGGSTFTPNSDADSSTPIVIKVANSINPDSTISSIRLFGTMKSYATAHLGNGISSTGGGRSAVIGGGLTKTTGNDAAMFGQQMYNTGNGNAMFGRNHIARKNRWLIAGTGHDTTNGKSEAGAVLGEYALISSDTAFAIGNGTSATNRSNLFEIKTNGDVYLNGTKVLP